MDRFTTGEGNRIDGPHQGQPVASGGVPAEEADATVVLIHGRGATAESMLLFAREFDTGNLHFIAPQAYRNAWYPFSFLAPVDNNEPGISSGLQLIHDIIREARGNGENRAENLALVGFSQGACLALEYAARQQGDLDAAIGLSGGLIGPEVSLQNYHGDLAGTEVYLGCSDDDPHIPEERVHESGQILSSLGAEVTADIFKGMGHTVNQDEIDHIKRILRSISS